MAIKLLHDASPELKAAQARLAEVRAETNDYPRIAALRDRVNAAYERLLNTETAVALGKAKPADVAQARAAWDSARDELDAVESRHFSADGVRNKHERELCELIESLTNDARAANAELLLPDYRAAVKELDTALEAARVASEKLVAIQTTTRHITAFWPGPWVELHGVNGFISSRLYAWRERCRREGLL
jgi:hypothetical protein